MKASELKVTDLMVGDLVLIKEKDGKKLVGAFRVVAIGKTYLGGYISDFVENGMVSISYIEDEKSVYQTEISNIEPIQLTPEILEKNGFETKKIMPFEQEFEHRVGVDGRVELDNRSEYIRSNNTWQMYIKGDRGFTLYAELTFVHELQQFLRLCKIEKEIVV